MTYDCFTFFNELDLLEIRMNILDSVVDRFVIVEAPVTQLGKPKPLYFAEHKERYAKFSDKIIHVVADNPPLLNASLANANGDNWHLENWQRAQIARALSECKDDDTILVSDLDEIPRPEFVLRYRHCDGVTTFAVDHYYFYLNFRATFKPFEKTVMASYHYFRDVLPTVEMNHAYDFCVIPEYRTGANANKLCHVKPTRLIKHGGWHFSYLGGVERVIEKRRVLLEQNLSRQVPDSADWVRDRIYQGLDPLGNTQFYYPTMAPWRLPRYIREQKASLTDFFYHASLLHCLKLQMRVVMLKAMLLGALLIRSVCGNLKFVHSIRRCVLRRMEKSPL